MSRTIYKNPSNGYEETITDAGLLCLLFGPLYFAAKGVWTQAVVSLILAIVTFGLSWIVYPFLARGIVEKNYLRKGWVAIEPPTPPKSSKKVFLYLFLFLVLFAVFLIGMAANLGSHPPRPVATATATTPAQLTAPVNTPSVETWEYTTQIDAMTLKEIWGATVTSNNTISLDFPYTGDLNATLSLRKHPQHGKSIIFQIERGQLLCDSYDGCSVLVRFDDQPAEKFAASPAADQTTTVLFIKNYDGFVHKLVKASKVFVQVAIYQNGNQTLEFNVSGLKLNKTAGQ